LDQPPSIPIDTHAVLNAQADAFAQLLGRSPDDVDAWRRAAALADGLFPHQVEGVAFLLGRRRAILADDMGLGKTRQAIVSLRHDAPDGPFLVVCPASVKRNWAREIGAIAPTASILVLDGGTAVPDRLPAWTIVNYDILARHLEALGRASWAGLVFDEVEYVITAGDVDVECSCLGFEMASSAAVNGRLSSVRSSASPTSAGRTRRCRRCPTRRIAPRICQPHRTGS